MTYRTAHVLALACALFLAGACGNDSSAGLVDVADLKPGDTDRGKRLFQEDCAGCHGSGASGEPGQGPDLVTEAFVKDGTPAEIMDFIRKGEPEDTDPEFPDGMPPLGGNESLTAQDLMDIVAWLKSINRAK
jgi:mono/diheme cytochrome c family protein